jgi:gluconate kinase
MNNEELQALADRIASGENVSDQDREQFINEVTKVLEQAGEEIQTQV